MTINDIEQWNDLLILLRDAGYTIWQMQFGVEHPEGFIVSFYAPGRPNIEIITHSQVVHDSILRFGVE